MLLLAAFVALPLQQVAFSVEQRVPPAATATLETRAGLRGEAHAHGWAAGPWVPKVGSGYHKVSANAFRSRDFFGIRPGFEEFTDANLTYYGEVGIVPRLALYGSVPLQRLRQREGGGRTEFSGIGDVNIGIRHGWLTAPFVFSGSFLVKLPYLYDENAALPPGNGQEDFEGRLLIGKSLGSWAYFGLEGGYRARSQEPSDEIRYLAEFGLPAGAHLYLRTKLDATESVRNGDPIPGGVGNPTLNPEFDLGRLELTAGWNFGRPNPRGRVGAEFTWTRDLYGENTLRGNTFQLGVTLVN